MATETIDLAPGEFEDAAAVGVGKRRRCLIAVARARLSEVGRKVLDENLAKDPLDMPHGAIATVLEGKGLKVSHNAVSAHRKRTCQCFKTTPSL